MKKKPILFLISCPTNTAHNPEEITTMIQPQFPGICLQDVSAKIPAKRAAIYRSDSRLNLRHVL
jgi:hypothetical protein